MTIIMIGCVNIACVRACVRWASVHAGEAAIGKCQWAPLVDCDGGGGGGGGGWCCRCRCRCRRLTICGQLSRVSSVSSERKGVSRAHAQRATFALPSETVSLDYVTWRNLAAGVQIERATSSGLESTHTHTSASAHNTSGSVTSAHHLASVQQAVLPPPSPPLTKGQCGKSVHGRVACVPDAHCQGVQSALASRDWRSRHPKWPARMQSRR